MLGVEVDAGVVVEKDHQVDASRLAVHLKKLEMNIYIVVDHDILIGKVIHTMLDGKIQKRVGKILSESAQGDVGFNKIIKSGVLH